MQKALGLVLLLLALSGVARAENELNCALREAVCFHECCPNGANSTNDFVNNTIYVLSSNRITKFADWVAYAVDAKNLNGPHNKVRNWEKDPNISDDNTLSPSDYNDAYKTYNYDRGHQAPLANFTNSDDWAKSNYLSNITPQQKNLNRGMWMRLEIAERSLVQKYQYRNVRVITGPYYDPNEPMPNLPKSHLEHTVPSGYWKVIVIENELKLIGVAAFKLSQNETARFYCNNTTDLATIKTITHLDVLPNLSDEDIDKTATQQLVTDLNCG